MLGNDLEKQIEIHRNRLEMFKIEKEYEFKKMIGGPAGYKPINMDGMPRGSSDDTSIDRRWEHLQKLQHMIELEEWAIEALEDRVHAMKEKIKQLNGLDARVTYLRDMEGMRLQEIADYLHISLDYAKKISARNKKTA